MSSLYRNTERKKLLTEQANKKIETLSLEYNPLNVIKKDLGITNVVEEEAFKLYANSKEIDLLESQYRKRVIDRKDLAHFVLSSNMVLRDIREYKSELSVEVLKAIKDFADENGINLKYFSDNFKILAPKKYFKKNNRDISNVVHNIYYKPTERGGHDVDKYIEVYGSDFKYDLFSPIKESVAVSTNKEKNLSHGIIILTIIFNIVMLIGLLMDRNIDSLYILMFLMGNLVFYVLFNINYHIIFNNKNYIDNLSDIKQTLRTGEGKI